MSKNNIKKKRRKKKKKAMARVKRMKQVMLL
jgi:hypothetical protein